MYRHFSLPVFYFFFVSFVNYLFLSPKINMYHFICASCRTFSKMWLVFSYLPCHVHVRFLSCQKCGALNFLIRYISVNSNQLIHIFIKKHIKIIQNSFTPTCFGSHRDPSSGGHHQILAKVFTGSWSESI